MSTDFLNEEIKKPTDKPVRVKYPERKSKYTMNLHVREDERRRKQIEKGIIKCQ